MQCDNIRDQEHNPSFSYNQNGSLYRTATICHDKYIRLKYVQNQAPHGISHNKNNTDGVWYAFALGEGIPEATRCADVLLQQVASYDKTNKDTSAIIPDCVGKEARSNHQ